MSLDDYAQIFPLDRRGCVVCASTPPCTCPGDQECSLTVQTCSECPQIVCQAPDSTTTTAASPTASPSSSHSNAGPIAGGVVGGLVVLIGITVLLLWKFVYSEKARKKWDARASFDGDLTPQVDAEPGYFEKHSSRLLTDGSTTPALSTPRGLSSAGPGSAGAGARMSAVTMSSLNTSSRGSNIIPIAYIPGVTSRADAGGHPHEQFFSASDILRESQISTGDDIRASIATTDYRGSAYDTVTAVQARPNLVDISNGASAGPRDIIIRDSIRDSTTSISGPIALGAAQPMQRLNGVRSIRIGKNSGVGLQSQLIAEEESDSEDVPPMPTLSSLTLGTDSSTFSVRSSSIAATGPDPQAVPRVPRPKSQTPSRASRVSRASKRLSAEYVADLPAEAYLYATSPQLIDSDGESDGEPSYASEPAGRDHNGASTGEGRSSPFDDKFAINTQS